MKYTLVKNEVTGEATVVAFLCGEIRQAGSTHPNFERICTALLTDADEEATLELFNEEAEVARRFERLSDRVTVANGAVYFDGDEVDEVISRQIIRFMEAGVDDWKPLVAFWEKLSANPSEHSREQLLAWLNTHDFSISNDGDIVGYKGLSHDRNSIHSGGAIVDDVDVSGKVPNQDGSVIRMARSAVNANPSQGCSYGLHVGTYDYANSFGQVVVEVRVNPINVVSVPTDCSAAKMRVCEYSVVREVERAYDSPVVSDVYDEAEYDEDDTFGYCESCGDVNDVNEDGVCTYCDTDEYVTY